MIRVGLRQLAKLQMGKHGNVLGVGREHPVANPQKRYRDVYKLWLSDKFSVNLSVSATHHGAAK